MINANLSGLEIKSDELVDFIDAHAQTLRVLNISNCSRLSSDVLKTINMALMKVHDHKRLYRMVTLYEVPYDNCNTDVTQLETNGYPFVFRKLYHNGQFITEINHNYSTMSEESQKKNTPFLHTELKAFSENYLNENPFVEFKLKTDVTVHCNTIPRTDFDLHKEMGLFDDPEFVDQYFRKQPFAIASYDHIMDDLRHFNDNNVVNMYEYVKTEQVTRTPTNSAFIDNDNSSQCHYCNLSTQKKRLLILPKKNYHSYARNDFLNFIKCNQPNSANYKCFKVRKLSNEQHNRVKQSKVIIDGQCIIMDPDEYYTMNIMRLDMPNHSAGTQPSNSTDSTIKVDQISQCNEPKRDEENSDDNNNNAMMVMEDTSEDDANISEDNSQNIVTDVSNNNRIQFEFHFSILCVYFNY